MDRIQGTIFDIKELTVHDGPGVRVTVFFKGCPLRCRWCHNPEGLTAAPSVMRNTARCTGCGKCKAPCDHEGCRGLGACVRVCPMGLVRAVGETVEAGALAARLKRHAPILQATGGGISLSGGEPLMQPDFLRALLRELRPMHRVLQTSGYGDAAAFLDAAMECDLVLFDLKQMDPERHREFTGVDNGPILHNLRALMGTGKEFVARLPMIPGVNIAREHFEAVRDALLPARDRVRVELLPYNPFAGAKYPAVGMEYGLDVPKGEGAAYPVEIFEDAGLSWRVL